MNILLQFDCIYIAFPEIAFDYNHQKQNSRITEKIVILGKSLLSVLSGKNTIQDKSPLGIESVDVLGINIQSDSKIGYRKPMQDIPNKDDKFFQFYSMGLSFRMKDPQATYFACIACGYTRQTTIEKTGSSDRALSSLIQAVDKKLGINKKYHPNLRREKLKELANLLLEFENPKEALTLAADSTIEQKLDYLRKQQENELIAKIVREDPDLLEQVINKIDDYQLTIEDGNQGK